MYSRGVSRSLPPFPGLKKGNKTNTHLETPEPNTLFLTPRVLARTLFSLLLHFNSYSSLILSFNIISQKLSPKYHISPKLEEPRTLLCSLGLWLKLANTTSCVVIAGSLLCMPHWCSFLYSQHLHIKHLKLLLNEWLKKLMLSKFYYTAEKGNSD